VPDGPLPSPRRARDGEELPARPLRPERWALRVQRRRDEQMLDAPCGHGRNARLMTALGFAVVCLDNAEERREAILDAHHYGLWVPSSFSRLPWASVPGPLTPMRADLLRGSLPFRANSFVGII